MALLSDDERARHARVHADRDPHAYAIAHALLRSALSEISDVAPNAWRFTAGANGKPYVAGLSFNLTHARGLVACVVSSAPAIQVGIDAECVTRPTDWRAIAGRYFSAAEVAEIARMPEAEQPTRFFELWTLKEAFAKATGLGLSQSLNATSFSFVNDGVIDCVVPYHFAPYHFALYAPLPTHRLAVAVSDGATRRRDLDVRMMNATGPSLTPLRTTSP